MRRSFIAALVLIGLSSGYPARAAHLHDDEMRVIRFLVRDDLAAYSEGRKSSRSICGKYPFPVVTVQTLDAEFHKNEVAAERQYGTKLFVKGTVTAINKGLGRRNYLSLFAGIPGFCLDVQAYMANGTEDYCVQLRKSDTVSLFCEAPRALLGSVILTECEPSFYWVERETLKYMASMERRLQTNDEDAAVTFFTASALTTLLPRSSPCFQRNEKNVDDQACKQDVEIAFSSPSFEYALERAKSRYKTLLRSHMRQR